MTQPDPFRMTKLVVSFNRHFFFIAAAAAALGVLLVLLIDLPWLEVLIVAGVLLAVYFMLASLLASHLIYDRSDLYKLEHWPQQAMPKNAREAVLIHAGFDPVSGALRRRFPHLTLRVLDFFDASQTTEASINLAHALNPPSGPQEHTVFDAWPVADASQDVVLAISAAHELRTRDARAAFFREARRVLRPQGRVVVIEQLRDVPNFSSFGFAAFHFLSHGTWLQSFRDAGLTTEREFKITPFMSVFVLKAEAS